MKTIQIVTKTAADVLVVNSLFNPVMKRTLFVARLDETRHERHTLRVGMDVHVPDYVHAVYVEAAADQYGEFSTLQAVLDHRGVGKIPSHDPGYLEARELEWARRAGNLRTNTKIAAEIASIQASGVQHPTSKAILDAAAEYLVAGEPRYRGEDSDVLAGFGQVRNIEHDCRRTNLILCREPVWLIAPLVSVVG